MGDQHFHNTDSNIGFQGGSIENSGEININFNSKVDDPKFNELLQNLRSDIKAFSDKEDEDLKQYEELLEARNEKDEGKFKRLFNTLATSLGAIDSVISIAMFLGITLPNLS